MKKKVLLFSITLVFLFLAGIGWIIWQIKTDSVPTFFPLNNPEARYTIVKSSDVFQGWNEIEPTDSVNLPTKTKIFYMEYRGENVFADEKKVNFFRIMIGKSEMELDSLVDKDVKIIKGEFVSSTQQCILDKCTNISGPHVVLNLDQVQLNSE